MFLPKSRNSYFAPFFCFVLLLGFLSPIFAQQNSDTLRLDNSIYAAMQDSAKTTPEKSLVRKEHSPSKALWMSAVLPGLGQGYNKQYWKIPIIYALGGTTTYFAITNYREAQKFKDEYKRRDSKDSANFDPSYINYPNESIYNLYNAYNKNFQLMIVLTSVVYVLNLVDAYVFAHLFTFDISDEISMQITPAVNYSSVFFSREPEVGFSIKLKF